MGPIPATACACLMPGGPPGCTPRLSKILFALMFFVKH